jgi:hypothetical protein
MTSQATQIESRRRLLRLCAAAAGAAWLLRAVPARAKVTLELPHLSDANPTAASLGYTEDTSRVDQGKFPRHKPDQRCANCRFFQASAGADYAPCQIYPGHAVNANGWCAGYAVKS